MVQQNTSHGIVYRGVRITTERFENHDDDCEDDELQISNSDDSDDNKCDCPLCASREMILAEKEEISEDNEDNENEEWKPDSTEFPEGIDG